MNKEKLEKLTITCIDTAQAMLDEYGVVVPFGIRAFKDSNDLKMNCPAKEIKDADWVQQIDMVVADLKEYLIKENIVATALVTGMESDEGTGLGLQIETEQGAVLFVYPYKMTGGLWKIDEPIQTQQLLSKVYG